MDTNNLITTFNNLEMAVYFWNLNPTSKCDQAEPQKKFVLTPEAGSLPSVPAKYCKTVLQPHLK